MDYVIKNHKNVYIRLSRNGRAETCSEQDKALFEYSKAKNICASLPKTLKKLNFKVEALPDVKPRKETVGKKVIETQGYIPSESITQWVEKFGLCSDILEEAKQKETVLIEKLKDTDKELLDILHSIEIENSKDLYGGWQLYKKIKNNREKRREIKDEILIVENVLSRINPSCMKREQVQKAIDGLFKRKYTFRIVEEEDSNADL